VLITFEDLLMDESRIHPYYTETQYVDFGHNLEQRVENVVKLAQLFSLSASNLASTYIEGWRSGTHSRFLRQFKDNVSSGGAFHLLSEILKDDE
jgi:hypothetical protein